MYKYTSTMTFRHILKQGLWIALALVVGYLGVSGFIDSYTPESNVTSTEWIETNIQAVQQLKEPVCFAVIGGNSVDRKAFQHMLTRINGNTNIQFTVNLANMVKQGTEQEIIDLVNLYKNTCGKPLLPAFGTHDSGSMNSGVYAFFFGPLYYSFQVGNVVFVMMDTSLPASISDQQFRWLEATITMSHERHYQTLVFMSVPLQGPENSTGSPFIARGKSEKLLALFRRFPPTHVFSSHGGGYNPITLENNIPYTLIGFPNQTESGDATGKVPGFLQVTVTSTGVTHVDFKPVGQA
jgi:serine/threonine-protein phosphatase CPPED1